MEEEKNKRSKVSKTNTKKNSSTTKKVTNNTKKKSTNRINSKKKENDVIKAKEKKIDEKKDVEENKVSTNLDKENKTTTFNLIEVVIIMIITAVFGILIGSCVTYLKDNVIDNDIPDSMTEFLEVYNEIVDNYYEDVDSDALLEAGIEGMVDYLSDTYSTYLDTDETANLVEELEGEFVGMGATVTTNDSGEIYIVEIISDSPAEKAGFSVGDIILSVGGTDVSGMTTSEVSTLIKGEENTIVDITIRRDGEEQTITLTRGKVAIQSVSYSITENSKIGYIYISIFAKNTPDQFKSAMDALIDEGVESVIIDVRNNNGGYLSSAEEIASMFLDKGSVIYQLDTKGEIEKVKSTSKKKYDVNVAILINESSASASEVLSAALSENLGSILVGRTTYGKGTVQKTITLSSGAMVKYTIQEWLTPNGNSVEGVGLTPDYEVSLTDSTTDTQLAKAIEVLSE